MANEWITWVLKEAPLDDPTETFVLMVLADSSNTDGVTWPNKKTLAGYTRLTSRSIARIIASLEEKTLLQRSSRWRDSDRGQTSNYYQLFQRTQQEVDAAVKAADERRKQEKGVTPMTSPHVIHDTPPMLRVTSLGVTPMTSQEPLVESSVESKKNQPIVNALAFTESTLFLDGKAKNLSEEKPLNTDKKKQKPNPPPTPSLKPAGQLAAALGLKIVEGDGAKFGKVAAQLNKAGITSDEFSAYVEYWRDQSSKTGGWPVTLHSLTANGRMSVYMSVHEAKALKEQAAKEYEERFYQQHPEYRPRPIDPDAPKADPAQVASIMDRIRQISQGMLT